MGHKARILIAKPGLDGHDRGARVVAWALRDANMEVIYTGRRQTPEQIVRAAIEEDVDAIGLSCLSGAHSTLFLRVLKLLEDKGASDILVFAGGIIPKDDAEKLRRQGIIDVFGPGTPMHEIVRRIRNELSEKRKV